MKASVVILTKNGGDRFRKVMDMVFAQEASFPFEVVVVDSGSIDDTVEVARSAGARVVEISPEEFRFGPTRDLAFKQARGEIVVTISQDVLPISTNWLQAMCRPFDDEGADVVQMWAVLPERETFWWEGQGALYYTRDVQRWLEQYGIGLSCHCLAVRLRVWDALKFGDALMAEDKVLQKKLVDGGYKIVVAPEPLVEHHVDHGVWCTAKRCLNEGMGWRFSGVRYSAQDALIDTLKPGIWWMLLRGVLGGRVRRLSEFLYPVVRPACIWFGNRFVRHYVR